LLIFGPNAAFNGPNQVDDSEHEIVRENVKESEWVSFRYSFDGIYWIKKIKVILHRLSFPERQQEKVLLYIDNLYFYNTTSSTNNLLSDKVKNISKSGEIR
jgi:hypothetical protein